MCLLPHPFSSVTGPTHMGNTFYLTFAEHSASDQDVEIVITNTGDNMVHVEVITSDINPAMTESLDIAPDNSQSVVVPGDIRIDALGTSNKGVLISADDDVSIATLNVGSCAGYLAFPVASLGMEYYAVTWWPLLEGMTSQIIVSAVEDDTEIVVIFSSSRVIDIEYNGQTYGSGDTMTFTLQQYQTFLIEDDNDLSGTYITSSKDIAVFGGNNEVAIDSLSALDTTVAQLLPVGCWGYQFYAVTMPDDNAGYYLKFVTTEPNTEVQVSNYGTIIVAQAGEFREVSMPGGLYSSVKANKAIMLVYYTKGMTGSTTDSSPAALLIPPAEQYLNSYDFSTVITYDVDVVNHLLLAIDESRINGLELDGVQLDTTGWVSIPSGVGSSTMVGKAIALTSGAHIVRHTQADVLFAAYVHGNAEGDCSYAFPAGMKLVDLRVVSTFYFHTFVGYILIIKK